jgi:aerobic-type carbon monoxide dehydrogenase small subunit (CoxS/CutS family)
MPALAHSPHTICIWLGLNVEFRFTKRTLGENCMDRTSLAVNGQQHSVEASPDTPFIERLSADGQHPVQQAWLADEVPQCGCCQARMMMATAAPLAKNSTPAGSEIAEALGSHICRCGTFRRVRQGLHQAAAKHAASETAAPRPAATGGAR